LKPDEPAIICLAFTAFRGDYAKSTTQIMGRLAKDRFVLYIDYQYTVKDLIDSLLGRRSIEWKRILGFSSRTEELLTNVGTIIQVLSLPPVLPINWINNHKFYKKALKINSWIISGTIKNAIKKYKLEKATVINAYNPFYGLYSSNLFTNNRIIYYCYDEISGSPWAKKHGSQIETSFLSQVDDVIVSSSALKLAKEAFHPKVHLIENGVDFQMFNAEYKKNNYQPKDPPIIGYIGSLDERIDYALLRQLAIARPKYHFRFIGRVVFPELIHPISNISNIEILDPIPYNSLPIALGQFTVGLIPFLKTKFTKNIYPLKINEYLAMGKAVVRTDFADLEGFNEVVWTGKNTEEFISCVDDAVKPESKEKVKARIDKASQNSWNQRVKNFKEILQA
jgi:hypothetical protein